MSKGKVLSYVGIDNVSNLYLDYLLIDNISRKTLEAYLKGDSELTKKIGLASFRLNAVDDYRLKTAFAKHLPKDVQLFSRMYELWKTMYEDDFEEYIELSKEEFLEKIPGIITIVDVPNLVSYIRLYREELQEAAAPLLKEWHSINAEEKEKAEKLGFKYGWQSFSEIYGFDPLLDMDLDIFDELDLEEPLDDETEEDTEELSSEKILAKRMMEMPVDKSLNAILISLGALKNKFSRAADYEGLYKNTQEELKKLKQDYETSKKEASEAKSKLKEKEAAFDSAQKKVNASDKKLNELNQKIASINSENGRLGGELGTLRKELASTNEKLKKAEKQATEQKSLTDKKLSDLEKEMETKARKEINKLKERYEEQLKAKDREIEKLRLSTVATESIVTLGDFAPDLKGLFETLEEEKINIGSVSLVNKEEPKTSDEDIDLFGDLDEFVPS